MTSASSPTGGSWNRRPIRQAWDEIGAVIDAATIRSAVASCCWVLKRRRTNSPRASRPLPRKRHVKGFAVGRTIFNDAAQRLAGRHAFDDEAADHR